MNKNTKKYDLNPLVSFCIATYKRPEFLKSTLKSLLKQTYKNYEIIVTDNDQEGSSEKIVNSLRSKKIKYVNNRKNLGMVGSFNNGFSYAKGNYITFISDDDPLMPNMLNTLIKLYRKYPNCVAYYGTGYVKVTSDRIGKANHLPLGLTSLRDRNIQQNLTALYSPDEFLKKLFLGMILSNYIWSTGIISKNVLNKISGIPNYGYAHFTDYALLIKVANEGNIAIINKELGITHLHEDSYFKKDSKLSQYADGAVMFYKYIYPIIKIRKLAIEFKKFISSMLFYFLVHNNNLRISHLSEISIDDLFQTYKKLSKHLKFMKNRKVEIFLRLNYPTPFNFIYNSINFFISKFLITP